MTQPAHGAAPATELPLRPQDELECRRCEVHCDKVVYPSACIDRACPFLYAFQEFGHTYIGCMQKVYGVEIDLEMLREAEARREGFGAMRWEVLDWNQPAIGFYKKLGAELFDDWREMILDGDALRRLAEGAAR